MSDDWTIRLSRDEGLVLGDYLYRWSQTEDLSLAMDYGERSAFMSLLAYLEKADDGTVFSATYAEEIEDAKARLVERTGRFD